MIAARYMMLALVVGAAGIGARVQRDSVLETLTPVARAAVVEEGLVQPAVPAPTGIGPAAHNVDRGPDGLFYVQAQVNGRPIRFLVDTGASVVVLTATDARTAGIDVHSDHYNGAVDTVGGKTPMAWANMAKVELAGHEVRDVRAAVVRDGLGVSLLGQNMLAKLDSVTMTADRLSLR
ncbi:aspartyl protease family protein [Sphingomonas gellani]|uniref:Aspartyl protease family protein n=1 Tax=Sphingomonas gellani TaxID=1166340 RepID=A0A1H8HYZ6_9SPHN|nr:TIGR02281 family clan AA aspartic protease [Sphingomonas gellani]SEN61224.1 aspartyl protease family protein [Sphingomonas gellani]